MAKFVKIQSTFTGGEASPRTLARVDLKRYQEATKTMTNAFPFVHGGCTRRHGTELIIDASSNFQVADSSKEVRLIPFEFSQAKSFILIFNNDVIQFIDQDGDYVMDATARFEVAHTFTEAELADITYTQFGSIMFLAHVNHAPQQLRRVGSDTVWVLEDIDTTYNATTDQWYESAFNTFKIISGASAFVVGDRFEWITNGSNLITSQSSDLAATLGAGDIASLDIILDASGLGGETWVACCIFATQNRQEWNVTGTITGTPTSSWSACNYPNAVAFYEQRLFFGGTKTRPQTVWGSNQREFANFTPGTEDDDAFERTIASGRFDEILHLVQARQLIVLTAGSEFSIAGGGGGITPTNIDSKHHTSHGVTNIKPVRIGREVVFAQRNARKLRGISFAVTLDQNVAPDLTIFSEHITASGLKDMSHQQDPDSILWCPRVDGDMVSLTLERDQEVVGWARHTTGASGKFERVASIPAPSGDSTYICIQRQIDGSSVRYIERFDLTENVWSDCSIRASVVTPSNLFIGFDALEGQVVTLVADGFVHGSVTVSAGAVRTDDLYTSVIVGLAYESRIEMLHPENALADGTSQGRALSIHEAVVRFQDTAAARVGNKEVFTESFASELPLFTGDKDLLQLGWSTPNNLSITNDKPVPWTVLGVIQKISVND